MAKNREAFEDDGRTIANMNVEGMPWYLEKAEKMEAQPQDRIELTKEEARAMMAGIMKATLMVTAFFGIGFTLFVLLCTEVLFR